jgi:hypothetical protein
VHDEGNARELLVEVVAVQPESVLAEELPVIAATTMSAES